MPLLVEGAFYAKFARGGKGPLALFSEGGSTTAPVARAAYSGLEKAVQQQVENLLGETAPQQDIADAIQFVLARAGGREINCPASVTAHEQPLLNIGRALATRAKQGVSFDNRTIPLPDQDGNRWIRSQRQIVTEDTVVRSVKATHALAGPETELKPGIVSKVSAFDAVAAPPRISLEKYPECEWDATAFEVVQAFGVVAPAADAETEELPSAVVETKAPHKATTSSVIPPAATKLGGKLAGAK
jgi:hypothetical protein